MDRNQEPDHPVDAPIAPVTTQPAAIQHPATQVVSTPVASGSGSVMTPTPVPTPFTQAATAASNTAHSQPEQFHPASAPVSPPVHLPGPGTPAEPTIRPTLAPILVPGSPNSPTQGPGHVPTHTEPHAHAPGNAETQAPVPAPGPTPGNSQPTSLHRGRDPIRQTTLSIEKIPLDDATTLPGIGSPRRRGSQANGGNPLPLLPHDIHVRRPATLNRRASAEPRPGIDWIVPLDEKVSYVHY
jgi:hypothetical protein